MSVWSEIRNQELLLKSRDYSRRGLDLGHSFPALAGHHNHLPELVRMQKPEPGSRSQGSESPGIEGTEQEVLVNSF